MQVLAPPNLLPPAPTHPFPPAFNVETQESGHELSAEGLCNFEPRGEGGRHREGWSHDGLDGPCIRFRDFCFDLFFAS